MSPNGEGSGEEAVTLPQKKWIFASEWRFLRAF